MFLPLWRSILLWFCRTVLWCIDFN